MIKLTRDEEPKKEIVNNASSMSYKSSYKYDDSRWKPLTPEDFFDVKFGEIFKEEKRIIVECQYLGKPIYFVCNDVDMEAIKRKYEGACVVHVNQLYRMWTGVIDGNYVMNVLPKVLMAITHFEGAKVVDVKRLTV